MARLLFVVNDAEFFISHRLPVAEGARRIGYDVHVATPDGPGVSEICARGFPHHCITLSRKGRHPLRELASFLSIHRVFRELNPDLVHLVTIKPVIYGGVAARLSNVSGVVAAISGLGHIFANGKQKRFFRRLLAPFYRFALGHRNIRVIFQNQEDHDTLVELASLQPGQVVLIPGSGVDLQRYQVKPEPTGTFTVAFASRLLHSKGIGELIAAARELRARGHKLRVCIAGRTDPGNPLTVTEQELAKWRAEGNVEFVGQITDIPLLFANAHVVVLPSYYGEGLPKVLLEAAACGRAIVTTDHPGCRDAIEPGITGILVPPRDAKALANAIESLLLDEAGRSKLATRGRKRAEMLFAVELIVGSQLEIYRGLALGEANTV